MTSYVGNTPADKTLKLEKQQFTTSATTSYTLSHSVSDPQDIALFINNVRQNPNSSYTVSGTALTLSAATASTDTMYCVFLGRAIGTVGIGAGSVTKDKVDFISDSSGSGVISKGDGSSIDGSIQLNCHVNSHGIKLKSPPHSAGQSYTLTFPQTAPSAGKVLQTDGSGNLSFGGNTPAVIAYQSSDQNLTKNSYNKIVNWTTSLDTNSAFSSNKFTVPSGEAGKYLINWQLKFDGDSSGNSGYDLNRMSVFKNGSEVLQTDHVREPQIIYGAFVQFGTLDLSASDYLEFYFYPDRGGGTAGVTVGEIEKTYFTIIKLIGV